MAETFTNATQILGPFKGVKAVGPRGVLHLRATGPVRAASRPCS